MSDGIDGLAKDGKKIGHKAIGALTGLGAIVAGVGLAASDIGLNLGSKITAAIGIKSKLLGEAITIGIVVLAIVVVLSLRGLVHIELLKMIFAFLGLMLATYLVIKVIRLIIQFITGKLDLSGGVE